MGTEYAGSSLEVVFGATTLSGQGRTVSVSEEAGEPEEIDITHQGDTEREVLESFPGRQACSVEVGGLDEMAGDAIIYDHLINAVDTLFVYPEGDAVGKREGTLNNARLIDRSLDVPYDGAAEWSASFHAKNSITWGTQT